MFFPSKIPVYSFLFVALLLAKYEFKDAENHGKDSMGNYDLEFGRYWVAGATGELMDDGVIDTVNGGVTFVRGNETPAATGYCLTNTEGADPFANLSAFTLAFEFQNHANVNGYWGTLIGWANDTNYLGLQPMADTTAVNTANDASISIGCPFVSFIISLANQLKTPL